MPTASGYASCSYELRHNTLARSAYLTFGVDASGTDPAAVATQLRTAFGAGGSLYSLIDSDVTLTATHVSLGTDGAEDITGSDPTPTACTKSGSQTPANICVLVHKRTARGGRRGRGRLYIPWCTAVTDVAENGIVASARVTLIQTGVNAWMTAVNGSAGNLVVLHRDSAPGTAHPTAPGPPNVVTSLTVDPLVGTQRRRLGR